MGWAPNHRRIKERYNPTPNAEEQWHEDRLKKLPCFGCGRFGGFAHHVMTDFPGKRWRRDHRYQLPICHGCHQGKGGIHDLGSERKWLERMGMTAGEMVAFAIDLWDETQDERRVA